MLIQFIRKDKRLSPLLLMGGFILLAIASLFAADEPLQFQWMLPLDINNQGFNANIYLVSSICFIGLYGIGILLHALSREHFLQNRNFFLSPWFFIWSCMVWYCFFPMDLSVAVLFLLTLTLKKLLNLFNEPHPQRLIYDSGALVAIAAILYPPAAIYICWVILAPFIFQNVKVRYILLILLGFFTPFFFIFIAQYLLDATWVNFEELKSTVLRIGFPEVSFNYFQLPFFFVYLCITAYFILELFMNLDLKPIRERKAFILASTFLLFTVLGCFLSSAEIGTQLILSCLASCFIWANYFTHSKNLKQSNGLLYLWLLSLLFFVLS